MRIILTIIFTLAILTAAAQATDPTEFYQSLNKTRKIRFRRELQIDTTLEKEARAWILKTKGKLWHDRSVYSGNEVLARSWEPLDAWMHSKGHKKTILRKKYRFVGYAVVMIDGIPHACARFR